VVPDTEKVIKTSIIVASATVGLGVGGPALAVAAAGTATAVIGAVDKFRDGRGGGESDQR